jgi:hypothetical protein
MAGKYPKWLFRTRDYTARTGKRFSKRLLRRWTRRMAKKEVEGQQD